MVLRGRCKGLSRQKCAKQEGFVACPKTMVGVGHLKRIRKDAFRMAGAVQETCSTEMLGGQVEHQIVRFAKIISLIISVTGAALRMTWHSGKNAKRIGTRPSALHSTLHF